MNQYEKELSSLKPYDPIQFTETDQKAGRFFITTAGHGYLVVSITDEKYNVAKDTASEYSFKGDHAIYLEEDCDYAKFIESI